MHAAEEDRLGVQLGWVIVHLGSGSNSVATCRTDAGQYSTTTSRTYMTTACTSMRLHQSYSRRLQKPQGTQPPQTSRRFS
jgi:hypothetical protein